MEKRPDPVVGSQENTFPCLACALFLLYVVPVGVYGPIAQLWLERPPDKREVSGSTPLRPTGFGSKIRRGYSSIGRAPLLQGGGHRFDSG